MLRELAEAYHAFSRYSAAHVRQMGLTPAQFDVIATLGNTQGMPLSQLAKRTLVTKGTLTGIIDRLEAKGLVRREVPSADRRSFRAILTPAGEALFDRVFPAHIDFLRTLFRDGAVDLSQIHAALRVLRERFSGHG
ncbi:MAG: MarR family transcriptional regulator [Gammaproteobacteria bacterium]|nr:MarR family transcriptional regulator [Gammaproteobacteria bacterium]